MRKAVYDNETHHYHIVDYFKGDTLSEYRIGDNLKEDYYIMARLVIGKDNSLRINDNKYIIKEPLPETFINKTYDLHICSDIEFYVISPEGYCTEYTLLLFLMDSIKKIRQISESKLDIAKKVFYTLVEEELNFTCENYTETRNKIFTQNITINEPFLKDPYAGGYTWNPSWITNYAFDPRNVTASTDSSSGKSTMDVLQEWSKLLGQESLDKLREMATGSIVTQPREVLANKIYDNTYEVSYNYSDFTNKKG